MPSSIFEAPKPAYTLALQVSSYKRTKNYDVYFEHSNEWFTGFYFKARKGNTPKIHVTVTCWDYVDLLDTLLSKFTFDGCELLQADLIRLGPNNGKDEIVATYDNCDGYQELIED